MGGVSEIFILNRKIISFSTEMRGAIGKFWRANGECVIENKPV